MHATKISICVGIFCFSISTSIFANLPASVATLSIEQNQLNQNHTKLYNTKQNAIPTISQDTKPLFTIEKNISSHNQLERANYSSPAVSPKTFIYGQKRPTIYCAPLYICDVSLEPDEVVQNILAGDTIRWKIVPALSHTGTNQTVHVAMKPTEYNIETNVLITTNKRSYEWRLVSIREGSHIALTHANYDYPENEQSAWEKQQKALVSSQKIADVSISPEQLNFNYKINCNWQSKPFCPLRVFDDKRQVYIQMPSSFRHRQAPVLLLWDVNHQTSLVNYRLQDDYYIVNTLFQQAILILGVGRQQQQATITRNCQKSWFLGRCQNE